MTIFLGFSQEKQCQDVKIEHSMYMQLGVFWNSLLIYKAIFPSSQMPNELPVAQNNIATFLDQRGVIFRTYLGVVDDMNRNMSKSKGWTLQSSLLTLWMDENSSQQSQFRNRG